MCFWLVVWMLSDKRKDLRHLEKGVRQSRGFELSSKFQAQNTKLLNPGNFTIKLFTAVIDSVSQYAKAFMNVNHF